MTFTLGTLEVTKLIIVTTDSGLASTIKQRYLDECRCGICRFAPSHCLIPDATSQFDIPDCGIDLSVTPTEQRQPESEDAASSAPEPAMTVPPTCGAGASAEMLMFGMVGLMLMQVRPRRRSLSRRQV